MVSGRNIFTGTLVILLIALTTVIVILVDQRVETDPSPPPVSPQAEPLGPRPEVLPPSEIDDSEWENPEEIPLPPYKLVGTVVASDPRWSSASIAENRPGGETRVYRAGDRLPDGAKLVTIRSSRVTLWLDGEKTVLTLDKQGPRSPGRDRSPPTLEGLRNAGPGRYRIDQQSLLARLDDPDELLGQVRVTLAFDAKLGIEGLRLDLEKSGSVFEQLGFENGDVIHRIGSVVIDGPERIHEIEKLLRNAREIDVEFSRSGELETLRYWID